MRTAPLFYAFFMMLTFAFKTFNSNAQTQLIPQQTTTFKNYDESIKALDSMTRYLDSIFLKKKYDEIIQVGEQMALDKNDDIRTLAKSYLIGAYYFSGNTTKSQNLLQEKITGMDYKELVRLLTTSNVTLIRYFEIEAKREPLITLTLGIYRASEQCTEKKAGEQIIKFFISDQRTRKLNRTYKDESEPLKSKIYKEVRMLDSIQNAQVLAFYKEHKKYLNKNEVGEVVAGLQPIILSHYDNIEQRQTFFKDMLERAVKEGRMEKTNYVHFILRTESFTNPDFFKNIEKRMAEVRKEYDLPDYMWTPF